MLMVDASASSPGSRVMMAMGDGPAKEVISAGSSNLTWEGSDADPYLSEVTFTVMGPGDRCESSVTLEPCEAPEPYCSIETAPQVKTGEQFAVAVEGHKEINLQVADAAGNVMPFSESMSLKRPGAYTISGTAANEVGETATCTASVEVLPRWTFRPFLARINPDDARTHEAVIRPNGVNERSDFNLDNDFGIGAELEYHFGPKIGLAAGLFYSEVEAHFMYDLDDLWGMDEDDVSMLLLTVGPNFHLTPDKRWDLYLQPFIGWADLGNATFNTLGETVTRKVDADDFVFGLGLGLDIPFGPATPWAFNLGARYVDMPADIQGNFEREVNIDPLIFGAGLSYSF
jgi:outer membrane protein W